MFEVEPNLWLQSFASPAVHWLMLAVTTLGYDWIYVVLIVLLGFGLRLRPTLGMMLALLLAGVATHAAKTGFALPRPSDVDARVLEKGQSHVPLVAHGGADRFLALPSSQARIAVRALPDPDYGFVSGHVAAATAMCLGLLLCFRVRKRSAWIALCAWPLLMGVSRMYLGRHFLADALGGLCVGIAMALLAAWWLPADVPTPASRRRYLLLAIATLMLCTLAPLTPFVEPLEAGRLAGLVIVLGVLDRHGYPDDDGGLARRCGRVACACAAYLAVRLATHWLDGVSGWKGDNLPWMLVVAIATAATFLAGVWAATRLRLFGGATTIFPEGGHG